MAYPTLWSRQGWSLDWTQLNGWTYSERWRGPAGVAGATQAAWLAEWRTQNGLETSVGFVGTMPLESGDSQVEATITRASTEDGDPVPPESATYGLLDERWTMAAVDAQRSIRDNPNVQALAERWSPWPAMIRRWVAIYQAKVDQALAAWDPSLGAQPNLPAWNVPAPPVPIVPTVGELLSATTLAERLLKDPNAVWETDFYNLRHTRTVTNWSTLVVSHLYKNRYLNWTALTTLEPTLASYGLIQTAGLTGLIWLKKGPEVTSTSGGNVELVQDYVGRATPAGASKEERDLIFDYGDIVTSIP